MNLNNKNPLAEELKGVAAALENAIEQLDFLIQGMLVECDCEDGCCK
jgi:hypothetical protein